MRPIVNGLEQYYNGKIEFDYIDYNSPDGQKLAAKYNVPGHPTFVTLDQQGNLKRTMPGVYTKEQLEHAIDESLK